jgi:hypothetical protein
MERSNFIDARVVSSAGGRLGGGLGGRLCGRLLSTVATAEVNAEQTAEESQSLLRRFVDGGDHFLLGGFLALLLFLLLRGLAGGGGGSRVVGRRVEGHAVGADFEAAQLVVGRRLAQQLGLHAHATPHAFSSRVQVGDACADLRQVGQQAHAGRRRVRS